MTDLTSQADAQRTAPTTWTGADIAQKSSEIAQIVKQLQAESADTDMLLRLFTKAAAETIGSDYASITVVTNGRIETPVMIGEIAAQSDALQQRFGEGPCIRSATDDTTVWIDDMRREARWPTFCAAAADLGIRSMACFCLYIAGEERGALNLHSTELDAFDDETRALGQLFAAHTATVFSAVREKEQLRTALSSRDLIGQAKGMLMERYRLGPDQAFSLLARLSQDSNTKLVDIAQRVVDAGPE